MLGRQLKLMILASLLMPSPFAHAEDDASDNEELQIIEVELEKAIEKRKAPPAAAASTNQESGKDTEFSTLGTLAPFTEVSVIQKRYLPKTGRFQLFGGLNMVTNNPFFDTYGLAGRFAYNFTETWGLEASYFSLNTTETKATKELKDFNNVKTENLIYPKSYMGLDVLWFPMYGKFTWFNKKIIPFDMYFSGGYGTTSTQSNENPGTFHIGTGQIFAMSKSLAIRWDFSWHNFSAKALEDEVNNFNFLFLSVGASFFFPEASYR